MNISRNTSNKMSELGKETIEELSSLYINSLNDRELQAYHIAVNHLGMSFNMERSNGFRQWKKERDERIRSLLERDHPQSAAK